MWKLNSQTLLSTPEVNGSTFVRIKCLEQILGEVIPAVAPEFKSSLCVRKVQSNFPQNNFALFCCFRRCKLIWFSEKKIIGTQEIFLPEEHTLGWTSSPKALHLGSLLRSWHTTPIRGNKDKTPEISCSYSHVKPSIHHSTQCSPEGWLWTWRSPPRESGNPLPSICCVLLPCQNLKSPTVFAVFHTLTISLWSYFCCIKL